MCTSANCNHNDNLDDDLDGLFDGPAQPLVIAPRDTTPKGDLIDAPMRATVETRAAAAGHRYEERCEKCRGTGTWSSYSGMTRGECFACKGKGKLVYKSSPEARQKARDAADRKRTEKAAEVRQGVLGWKDEHEAEWEWMHDAAQRGFDFASSMIEALHKYGSLTPKQLAAVQSATAKSLARRAAWLVEKAERESNKADVNVDKLAAAFATAKANKLKYPKIRLAGFVFSLAPDHGRNAGAIYVKADETYLGKVMGGKFTRSRDCSAELEVEITAAAADPEKAASAYGLQTGTCSCCGRELTNAESVGLGIGPICRGKFGW